MALANHFIVTNKDDRSQTAVFEGTQSDVYLWLSGRNEPDDVYEVFHVRSNTYRSVSQFRYQALCSELKMIPLNLVAQDYEANPETELLAPNGADLLDGMTVLLGDKSARWNLETMDKSNPEIVADAHLTNRWCTISDVKVEKGRVSFLGRYGDGTRKVRTYPTTVMWLVKSDFLKGTEKKTLADYFIEPEPIIPGYMQYLVPKFYRMNPEIEDVVINGGGLANGMKILIDSSDKRVNLAAKSPLEEWEIDRALEVNQWCTVSQLKIIENDVRFLALYEDGTKRVRWVSIRDSWIVKIDSLPDPVLDEEKEAQRYNNVLGLVKEAFDKHGEFCCTSCYGGKDAPSDEALAEEATRNILGLL